jgi:two-component system, NarL family, nitrate/nitrite response regulator NarL
MSEIVIGDDDVVLADALAAMISEGDRHVVTVASAAADVLATVSRTPPALCLLDRWFDDGDTLDLLDGLRQRSPSTKVVVLTADPEQNGAQQALDRGAQGFVHKTRGVSALVSAIERVLAGTTVVELPPRWSVSTSPKRSAALSTAARSDAAGSSSSSGDG